MNARDENREADGGENATSQPRTRSAASAGLGKDGRETAPAARASREKHPGEHYELSSPTVTRNFTLLTLYHVCLRTGWIFKTESIMMPAFADYIGGAQGWLRGCLPMLNRLGQSIPPLLASDWLRNRKIKRYGITTCTTIMGLCFIALAISWWSIGKSELSKWMPFIFLFVYAVFFAATGINELTTSTLVGKLIPIRRRGRLILVSTTLGAVVAVTAAWFLLSRWLEQKEGAFGYIFLMTGSAFLAAAVVSLFFKEEEDIPTGTKRNGLDLFMMSWQTFVKDRNFRLLAFIASMMGMTLTLMPHYQSLARSRLEVGLTALIPWLIAQNIGAAVFSWPAGWLGDRFGYRLVLKWIMGMLCVAPLLAIALSRLPGIGSGWYTVIFILLGMTPVSVKAFNNYTLEIVEPAYHPRYLSTMRLCMSLPAILTSFLLGVLVDTVSYEFVFGIVVLMVFGGFLATFRLHEPRDS